MPLSSHELIKAGIKPGEIFGKCLKLDSIEEAVKLYEESQQNKKNHKSVKMIDGSVWDWLCNHPLNQDWDSVESPAKKASKSERRRWIEQKSININGRTNWNPDDEMPDRIWYLVFFPNSKSRCTLLNGITTLQNVSRYSLTPPTIQIKLNTFKPVEFETALKNWLEGKNPTDSPEWKKGVFAFRPNW